MKEAVAWLLWWMYTGQISWEMVAINKIVTSASPVGQCLPFRGCDAVPSLSYPLRTPSSFSSRGLLWWNTPIHSWHQGRGREQKSGIFPQSVRARAHIKCLMSKFLEQLFVFVVLWQHQTPIQTEGASVWIEVSSLIKCLDSELLTLLTYCS